VALSLHGPRMCDETVFQFLAQPIYMTAEGKEYTNALKMSSSSSAVKSNTKMPADKKTAPKKETVAAPVVAAAPAPAKAAAPKKVAKETPAKAAVVIPTVTSAPVVVADAAAAQTSSALLHTLTEQLKALSTEFTTKVREAVKGVQEAAKAAKKEQRDSKKKRKINPADMTPEQKAAWEARRANNAFLVQRPLTPELCSFMGIAAGSKRSQTEVTKFISDYVRSHSCFDPSFKRRILPNAVLAKLLRVDDKTEVTYLNLQKFLKVHFIKPEVKA
jgi:chromatin remodeling complex protein RSC6